MEYFKQNIKFLRTARGLKQSDIHKQIGFRSTTWNNYEKGNSYPNYMDLLKIRDFFEISLTQLVEINLASEGDMPESKKSSKENETVKIGEINLETIEILKQTIRDKETIINLLEEQVQQLKYQATSKIKN